VSRYPGRVFKFLVARADAARDEKRYDAAAALYKEALEIAPDRAGVHIQRGHVLKEAGKLSQAEHHYTEAARLRPNDADLALQFGHFYKVAGRPQEAREAYRTAASLKPGWAEPARELENLDVAGFLNGGDGPGVAPPVDPLGDKGLGSYSAAEIARLVPALAPRRYEDLLRHYDERIEVSRFGREETGYWGNRRTIRGIEAIRGYCISATPILEVQVLLNGLLIHRGTVSAAEPLKLDLDQGRCQKYVFNLWLDFTDLRRGLHRLELRMLDSNECSRSWGDEIVIAEALTERDFPLSNLPVEISRGDKRPLEDQIRAKPSMVHAAKRALFPDGVRNVLVMRLDQLGDMVASVPALRRLRELVPDANIIGLFSPANAELARTLGLIDEVIVVDFPDDKLERRRLMSLDDQEALRRKLEPYGFDIALDLAQAAVSRDLLQLSGAKFKYGTGGEHWPWLSSDFLFHTRDRWTRHDMTPHSTKVLGLVETLGTLLKTSAPIIRRSDLTRDVLANYGIGPDDRFAVLHAGARIGFSRWPHYVELTRMLLDQTDLKIVMMTEDPQMRETMPADLFASDRFIYSDKRLPFDHFDAFLSFATVMVGNDSGPKHLASIRGTNVVTIFSARINWTEWGQENVGVIISRRLPCAGCAILHDADECGKAFACITDIKTQEVFDAMMFYVRQPAELRA
jgi:ADP-heptose:LPS heptosyltransferase